MTLLTKLFSSNKIKQPVEDSKPLKIIHAGGQVDCYYMAVSAASVMEKHPKCILARPEVFRKPWDSVVRAEEILKPGDKVYIMPRSTVRKLRKRIQRPRIKRESEASRREEEGDGKLMEMKKKVVTFVDVWEPSLMSIDEGMRSEGLHSEGEFSFCTFLHV